MIKLTVNFDDFDGVRQSKDVYFHLSKRELLDYDAPGKKRRLEELQEKFGDGSNIDQDDPESFGPFLKEYLDIFEALLAPAYGIRVDDANGQRFVKDETTRNLAQTAWYQSWLFDIAQDPEQMANIIKRLIPADVDAVAAQSRLPQDHLQKKPQVVTVDETPKEETRGQMEAQIRAQIEAELRNQTQAGTNQSYLQ